MDKFLVLTNEFGGIEHYTVEASDTLEAIEIVKNQIWDCNYIITVARITAEHLEIFGNV